MSESHPEPVMPESAQPSATTPALEGKAAPITVSPAESVAPLVQPRVAPHPQAPVRRPTYLRTIAVAGVTLVVFALLALPRPPSAPGTGDGAAVSQPVSREQPGDLAGTSPGPAALPAAPIAAPVATVASRAVSAPSKKTLVPKPEKNRIANSNKSGAPIAAVTSVADSGNADAAAKLTGSEPIAPAAPAFVSTSAGGTPVTITGCLEISVNHDEFRLTDTEGVDAPRSRSWRTGFLKKQSAPVALVEPPDALALQTQVGRRVAATGLLTSHDLKISALSVVGPPCN